MLPRTLVTYMALMGASLVAPALGVNLVSVLANNLVAPVCDGCPNRVGVFPPGDPFTYTYPSTPTTSLSGTCQQFSDALAVGTFTTVTAGTFPVTTLICNDFQASAAISFQAKCCQAGNVLTTPNPTPVPTTAPTPVPTLSPATTPAPVATAAPVATPAPVALPVCTLCIPPVPTKTIWIWYEGVYVNWTCGAIFAKAAGGIAATTCQAIVNQNFYGQCCQKSGGGGGGGMTGGGGGMTGGGGAMGMMRRLNQMEA